MQPGQWALSKIFAIIGTIFAGWAMTIFFMGKAHRMCFVCMAFAVVFMGIFIMFPGLPIIVSTLFLAMAGFFIYGPRL